MSPAAVSAEPGRGCGAGERLCLRAPRGPWGAGRRGCAAGTRLPLSPYIYRAGRQWGFPGRAACAPPRPHPPLGTLLSYQPDGSVPAPAPPAATRDPAGFHSSPGPPAPARQPSQGRDPRAEPPTPRWGAPPGCSGGRGGVQGHRGLPGPRSGRGSIAGPGGVSSAARREGEPGTIPAPLPSAQPQLIQTAPAPRGTPGTFPPIPEGSEGTPPPPVALLLAPAAPGTSPCPPRIDRRNSWALRCGRRAPAPEGTERRSPAPTRAVTLPPRGKQRLGRALPWPEATLAPVSPAPGPGAAALPPELGAQNVPGTFAHRHRRAAGNGPGPGHLSPAEGEGPRIVGPGSPCTARRPRGCGRAAGRAQPWRGESPPSPSPKRRGGSRSGIPVPGAAGAVPLGRDGAGGSSPCPAWSSALRGGLGQRGAWRCGAVRAAWPGARCGGRTAPLGGRGRVPRGAGHRGGSGAPSRGAARRAAEDE